MHAKRWWRLQHSLFGAAILSATLLIAACSGNEEAGPDGASGSAPPDQAARTSDQPGDVEARQRSVAGLLQVEPASGHVGDEFTISGEDFAPGAEVSFEWISWEGHYETEVHEAGAYFIGPRFEDVPLVLGTARADSNGRVEATFEAPVDFGGAHDIFAVVDDEAVARGGYQIHPRVTVSPEEGVVGSPITIEVDGMLRLFGRTKMSVYYNNQYLGYVSSTTTSGSATAVIRAAGPPGLHTIDLGVFGVHGGPFLTVHQSPYEAQWPSTSMYRSTFRVTEDQGGSEPTFEWPAQDRVVDLDANELFPTAAGVGVPESMSFDISPGRGPVETPIEVHASGFDPGAAVVIDWSTVGGSGGGQASLQSDAIRLGEFEANDNGELSATVSAPNHLGGWHAVQLVIDDAVVAERGFYTERSLVSAPEEVRLGEAFTIEFLGSGLYDLDNGWAVTYNNAYMGYGCGFTARGPVELHFVAAGSPGTHLIDIYPMVYRGIGGSGEEPWGYQLPQLNATEDHPGLDLGMSLPVIRVAIEVVE